MFRVILYSADHKIQQVYEGFETYGKASGFIRLSPPGFFAIIEKKVNNIWTKEW